MSDELKRSLRCRNYAEELRMIAAGMQVDNCLSLLRVAEVYEQIANSLETLHRSKRLAAGSLPEAGSPG